VGDACGVGEADATSVGVGEEGGLGDSAGVAKALGDVAGTGDGAGVAFALGVTTGAGPVLLSAADGIWELGELAGSAATPGRVDAHHIKTSNNTCRRNTRSRLVISRRREVGKGSFCGLVNLPGARSPEERSASACPRGAVPATAGPLTPRW
jgi:hypothetical protein